MLRDRLLNNKEHILYLSILFLFGILTLFQYFQSYDHFMYSLGDIDIGNFIATNQMMIEESIKDYHQFPFWNIYSLSGTPLFEGPQVGVFSLTTFLDIILPLTSYAAVKLSILIYYFLGALGVYLLMLGYGMKPKYSFTAALFFMVNGSASYFIYGYTTWTAVFSILPWIILFAKRSFETERWFFYCTLVGICLALSFLSGEISGFLYSALFFSLFIAYQLFSGSFLQNYKKAFLIGFFAMLICFGLIAVKALPAMDFIDVTQRSSKVAFSYDDFLGPGHHITKENAYAFLLKDNACSFPDFCPGTIGYVAFFFVLCSIPLFRKKKVLFFHLALILIILYMIRSPVSWFVWKFIPIFNQQRSTDKAAMLYNFVVAILAGFGFAAFCEWLNEKLKLSGRKVALAFAVLIAIFLLEIGFANHLMVMVSGHGFESANKYDAYRYGNYYNMKTDIEQNRIMQKIAEDKGLFRFKFNHINVPVDGANSFNVPLHLQDIYGNGNIYQANYPVLPMIAEQSKEKAKLYGILNVKYLISHNPINETGFELIGEFDEAKDSDYTSKKISYGPYLYENKEMLPRAFTQSNVLLIVGDKEIADRAMYSLMLDPRFDPKNLLIIASDKPIGSYSAEELDRYSSILILKGDSFSNLRDYKGMLMPDVLNGQQEVSKEDIDLLFNISGQIVDANIVSYSPNKVTVDSKKGFLVLSEIYSLHPGWKAYIGAKKVLIERADGAISAVYVNDDSSVEFRYLPDKFILGLVLFVITMLFLVVYYIYRTISKKFKRSPIKDDKRVSQ